MFTRRNLRLALATATAVSLTGGLLTLTTGTATAAPAKYADDFNGDGYADLAVGVPEEKVGSVGVAGGVHVLRGSRNGLTGTGSQWFSRATVGVPGSPTEYNMFGQAVRLRDLDGDGDKDLLISDGSDTGVLLRAGANGITTDSARELELRADFPQ